MNDLNMGIEEFCKRLSSYLDQEVIINTSSPPGYISNLLMRNQETPVILVRKEEEQRINTLLHLKNVTDLSGLGNSIADLSVTGQPLECPFTNDETLNISDIKEDPVNIPKEHNHAPLTMTQGRLCLSRVFLKLTPHLPVWVLTDMSDSKNTFLLGAEINSGWRCRLWAQAHSHQSVKMPIKSMLDDFETLFNVSSGYKITSEVSCVFDIKDQPGMAKNSKCFLEVNWQKPSYEVPVTQADTSLIIECVVGQEESQISRWWQQLNLLYEYLQIIKEWKSQQTQVTYQRDSIKLPSIQPDEEESTSVPLTQHVLDLLQKSDSMSVCRQMASSLSPLDTTSALNSTIHQLLTDKKKGQDFTDRLWSLLIEAKTYQELADCFQLIIKEVRKTSVKPYIFAKNSTRMAILLRSIKTGSSDMELMLEPLELIVEMGLEKLKRDYMFMFLSSQIASVESLCLPKLPIFSEVTGGEWQSTVDSWLLWLAQLHTVLELVSVIHSSLGTPTLVQVTALALNKYLHTDSPIQSLVHLINNRVYQLSAPVVSKDVKNFIEGDRIFHKWMLKLTALADKHKVTSTYVLLSDQSIFPRKIMMNLEEDDSLDKTEMFSETALQNSNSKMKFDEKYSYVQLCSVAEKLPY